MVYNRCKLMYKNRVGKVALSALRWDVAKGRNDTSCVDLPLPLLFFVGWKRDDQLVSPSFFVWEVFMFKIKWILIAMGIFALLAIARPLGLSQNQAMVLGSMVAAVILWATGGLHKSVVCGLLILSFSIFSETSAMEFLRFSYSDTMLLIIFTTLLSVGIMNSGAINGFVEKVFVRTGNNVYTILAVPYILGIALVFLIPQAFARVIIMGSVYTSLIQHQNEEELEAKQAVLFNLFFAISVTYMIFLNGDIVLNGAALSFSSEAVQSQLDYLNWLSLMGPPTIAVCALSILMIRYLFRRELSHFHPGMITVSKSTDTSKSKKWLVLALMAIVVLLWLFEDAHGIKQWVVALVATLVMFGLRVLGKTDLKSINLHFLLFLTTVFSIGKVFGQAGITEVLFQNLRHILVEPTSPFYLLLLVIVVMVLHLCIGSAVATMSVVLPILVPMVEAESISGIVITLLTYITVNMHFLLPFHHATMMIGSGREYFPDHFMTRLGTVMTLGVLVFIFGIYIPWWKILGLI